MDWSNLPLPNQSTCMDWSNEQPTFTKLINLYGLEQRATYLYKTNQPLWIGATYLCTKPTPNADKSGHDLALLKKKRKQILQ
jgi:hypothetical protein